MGLPKISVIDFSDLKGAIEAWKKKDVVRLYEEMYGLAESIANHEMKKEVYKKLYDHIISPEEMLEYRNKQLKFHMDNMLQLLRILIEQENNKEKN